MILKTPKNIKSGGWISCVCKSMHPIFSQQKRAKTSNGSEAFAKNQSTCLLALDSPPLSQRSTSTLLSLSLIGPKKVNSKRKRNFELFEQKLRGQMTNLILWAARDHYAYPCVISLALLLSPRFDCYCPLVFRFPSAVLFSATLQKENQGILSKMNCDSSAVRPLCETTFSELPQKHTKQTWKGRGEKRYRLWKTITNLFKTDQLSIARGKGTIMQDEGDESADRRLLCVREMSTN